VYTGVQAVLRFTSLVSGVRRNDEVAVFREMAGPELIQINFIEMNQSSNVGPLSVY